MLSPVPPVPEALEVGMVKEAFPFAFFRRSAAVDSAEVSGLMEPSTGGAAGAAEDVSTVGAFVFRPNKPPKALPIFPM
jgi:hypothetical protein